MHKVGGNDETKFKRSLAKLIKIDEGHKGIKLEIEENRVFGSITKQPINFIGVISGKGGVGKSSVAANIAYRLMKKGYDVGIIDADIYGASLPTILEVPHANPHFTDDQKIIPLFKDNMEIISTEFFTDPSQPVIWRGGMLNSMLNHFFYDVKWRPDTKFIIIDFPPGTGDITLDIKNDYSVYTIESDFSNTCYEISKNNDIVDKICTSKDPIVYKTNDLPYGNYVVKQVSVGLGYKKDVNVYNVSIDNSNSHPKLVLYNYLLKNKIEIIKQENPLMKNISIATRRINGSLVEYINIVDSNGESHLFENDRNVNIFNIYEELKLRSAGRDITPDELIYEIDRRLYQIRMQKAGSIMDSSNTSEDFSNKIKRVNEPYKNDRTTDVFGNEEHDVAIVSDLDDPTNHKVVTFDKNEFGDLVLESHEQNVVGTDTTLSRDGKVENSTSEAGMEGTLTEGEVFKKDKIEVAALLISTQEFYDLLNSPEELTEEQRKSVDLYYGYFGDLILYEDYLLPELKQILEEIRPDIDFEKEDKLNIAFLPEKTELIKKLIYPAEKKKITETEITEIG
mgnify:CR=1 FL=1